MTAGSDTVRPDLPRAIVARLLVRLRKPGYHDSLTIWVALIALVVIITVLVPEFLDPYNVQNVLVQLVPLGIASLGQLAVILGGGIDLSIGPVISLVTIALSQLAGDDPGSIVVAIAACLAIGGGVGLVNGLLAHYAGITPLIVTLCTGFIVQGIAYAFHQTTGGYVPDAIKDPLTTSWWIVPSPVLLYVAGVAVTGILLYLLPFGRWLYALGGSEEVLFATGVRVGRVRIATYVFAGLMAAVVGIYLSARLGSGSSHYGDRYALTTIAAVVVGGTSIMGGQGSLSGTVAGAVLVSMLNNAMNNISFTYGFQSSFFKDVMIGIILITAMLLYGRRRS